MKRTMNALRSTTRVALGLAVLFVLAPPSAPAAPGDLDPSFGRFGKRVIAPGATLTPTAVAVQSDGKVVLSGAMFGGGANLRAFAMRLNVDGSADPTFGEAGIAAFDTPFRSFAAVRIDPQGRIVLAAPIGPAPPATTTVAAVRLLADGSLDPSFGVGGVDDTGVALATGLDLALAADGRIVIAGGAPAGAGAFAIRRLPDGGPDPSFSGDGMALTPVGDSGFVTSVAVAPDGGVFAGGAGVDAGQATGVLIKYASDGELDPGFGAGGVRHVRFLAGKSEIRDLGLGPDGKVSVVGVVNRAPVVIARFDAAGQLDPGFSGDGLQVPPLDGFSGLGSILVAPNGRILVGGDANGDARVLRYRANGKRDGSFGAKGRATFGFGGNLDDVAELALGPDGKVAVVGRRGTSGFRSNDYDLAVAQLLAGGRRNDLDADGLGDARDLCPTLPSRARRGCPVFDRQVSIRYEGGKFKGRVFAPGNHRCVRAGRLELLEQRPGRDRVVGSAPRPRNTGRYTFDRPAAEGTFYVRVSAAVKQSAGLCGAARSGRIDVG